MPSTIQHAAFNAAMPSDMSAAADASAAAVGRALPPSNAAVRLRPKEHGAYAVVAIPMIAALLVVGPTVAGIGIAVATVAGFMAHEPLLLLWGHRGRRAQQFSSRACSRAALLLMVMTLGGTLAFASGSAAVRIALVACLGVAVTTFGVAIGGQHRALAAELWATAGLSLPSAAMLLAGGASVPLASESWAVWLLGFSATTVSVRSVIAAQKRQSRKVHDAILIPAILLVCGGILSGGGWLLATLPMLIASGYLRLWPPPAKYLRRVGWSLVASTLATAAWVVMAVG